MRNERLDGGNRLVFNEAERFCAKQSEKVWVTTQISVRSDEPQKAV
jgi:hypothetical protein